MANARRTIEDWLSEYGESHRNRTNQAIHKICVPLIMWSLLGVLWAIPVPEAFAAWGAFFNWATLFAVLCLIFYISLSFAYALVMLVVSFGMLYGLAALEVLTGMVLSISIAVFVLAWIAQFVGHKIEGKKPSFIKDLVFLLIGPLWVVKAVADHLGYSSSAET